MGTFITCHGDAGYDHEGCAAQVLDNGSLTSEYSDKTEPGMVGQVVAACGCGWSGTTRYPCPEPFDEAAEQLALAKWEHTHARPVLEQAQRVQLGRLRELARRAAAQLPADTSEVSRSARQLADQLTHAAESLQSATALARRLAEQTCIQAEHAEHVARGHGDGEESQT